MRRLLVENIAGETVALTGEQHHRAARVLRLGRGDRLRICDGRGSEFEALIESADRTQVMLRIERQVAPLPEPQVKVTLFQSVPRGDAMERVIQKCVEIGVAGIVPLITRRTVARASRQGMKLARWRKIALHAVEQSGRAWLVPVTEPVMADAVIPQLASCDLALVPHHGAAQSVQSALGAAARPQSIAIVIGPEGGFSPEEITRFAAAGARIVSLGPRVLRSETAGLVAATIVLCHYGEMG
jgi:16S rRNA (uracil1498-N3)-methyltransferase